MGGAVFELPSEEKIKKITISPYLLAFSWQQRMHN